jgi:hypothetical protein
MMGARFRVRETRAPNARGANVKKTDVQRSYHTGTAGWPMLNVKLHDAYTWRDRADVAAEVEGDTFCAGFAEWLATSATDDILDTATTVASEMGWERAVESAGEVFGEAFGHYDHKRRRVWSAGRSGGWLVVEGLPDVETWDAVAVARWSRFAREVRAILDGLAFDALAFLALNVYGPEVDEREACERKAENLAADAMAELLATH